MLKIFFCFMIAVFPQILKVLSAAETEKPPVFFIETKTEAKDPVLEFFHNSMDTVQYWFYQTFKSWLPLYEKLPWSLNHHDAIGWHKGRPVYKPWSKEELGMHHVRHEQEKQFDNPHVNF